jgi:hypothetical protein
LFIVKPASYTFIFYYYWADFLIYDIKALSVKLKALPLVLIGYIFELGEGISFEDPGCSFILLPDEEVEVDIPKHLNYISYSLLINKS